MYILIFLTTFFVVRLSVWKGRDQGTDLVKIVKVNKEVIIRYIKRSLLKYYDKILLKLIVNILKSVPSLLKGRGST